MEGHINIKTLTLDELVGVVNIYPWFSAARMELCRRMMSAGGTAWGEEQYSNAAMYINSRRLVADYLSDKHNETYSDKDVSEIVKSYINEDRKKADKNQREIRVVGGDYFSKDEYDNIQKDENPLFTNIYTKEHPNISAKDAEIHDEFFYTETLAQIYVEQGYYDIAIRIYSKLLLAYPEKNAYFATLIEKLKKEIKN